ncbi:hypothetical protein LIER_02238 [Lithospermum erythrorhizon]|uniref:Retrotransposon gag domain-containing protein n=1 Tax=Lithospermum erythrorhizon TaxID=34254 RepID=A0AAV3NNQ3_LITER
MPKFKTFSGFGDPSNHLKSFDSQLSFRARDDKVYVRAFPNSLSGQALKWFHKLPPNSIERWQDVTDLFMDKFGASIVDDEDKRNLMEIQQKQRKTLRSYATQFEEQIGRGQSAFGRNDGDQIRQCEGGRRGTTPMPEEDPRLGPPVETKGKRTLEEAKIERLVRRGQLKEFIKADQGISTRKPRELSPRERQGAIWMGHQGSKEGVHGTFGVSDGNSPAGPHGRPMLNALRAIVSLLDLKMKFPTSGGVGELIGDHNKARGQGYHHDTERGCGPDTALHRLHVDPSFRPIKQKKRNFSDEKNLAIQKEVADLMKSHAIRELHFP